jgi:hypothetical protein
MRSIIYGADRSGSTLSQPSQPIASAFKEPESSLQKPLPSLAHCATRSFLRGAGLEELCSIVKDQRLSPVVRGDLAQALADPTIWPKARGVFYRHVALKKLVMASMDASAAERADGPGGKIFAERFARSARALQEALPDSEAQCVVAQENRDLRWSAYGDQDLTPNQRVRERTMQRSIERARF